MKTNFNLFNENDLCSNPAPRIPVCICADTSSSMRGEPIEELNRGIQIFLDSIRGDEIARCSAEIALVSFNDKAECVSDFANVGDNTAYSPLEATGYTAMGEGVNMALDMLEKRKNEYKRYGVEYYQPWIVLLTDGQSNGDEGELLKAQSRAGDLVNKGKLTVMPIGIGNYADMAGLEKFSSKCKPMKLKGLNFCDLFVWLHQSVAAVSNSFPGDEQNVVLPDTKTWEEI